MHRLRGLNMHFADSFVYEIQKAMILKTRSAFVTKYTSWSKLSGNSTICMCFYVLMPMEKSTCNHIMLCKVISAHGPNLTSIHKYTHTCKFSLCLRLLITDRFLYASLDFLRRGPRNGSKFCRFMIKTWSLN